jgi:hypothetical protein
MSSDRLVYHLKDKDLFQIFIRGLSHKVLLEPVPIALEVFIP